MQQTWIWTFTRLMKPGFDDARGRFRGHDPCEAQPGLLEKLAVFLFSPLLASRSDEHNHVEQFSWMRSITRGKDHLDNQQSAVGIHGAPAVAKNREALVLRPIVDDVGEKIRIAAG